MRTFMVPSDSGDGKYKVTYHNTGHWSCECVGWKYNKENPKTCKHIKRVQAKHGTPKDDAPVSMLGFIKPMLAKTVPDDFDPAESKAGTWAIEEKYNGHRIIVKIAPAGIVAWSRAGNVRDLPVHLRIELAWLPHGTYDGELIVARGGRSWDVKRKTTEADRELVIFDVLRLLGQDTTVEPYKQRRKYLEEIFRKIREHDTRTGLKVPRTVRLAPSKKIVSLIEMEMCCREIWDRDGEGVILKMRDAAYHVGKRTSAFLKMKKKRSAVLKVVNWKAGKGKLIKRGPYAVAMLEDRAGNETRVKIRNDRMLADINREAKRTGMLPYLGRAMRIEYQERTPDGGYFHPICDRWEDE